MTLQLVTVEKNEQKRRCENWLLSFQQYTEPRSESPSSILFWTGLFTLASVVRRNVGISRDYLGGWDCYPSLYVILVGPQGSIKKSTTIGFAEDLLDEVKDELQLSACPEAVTGAELVKRLADASDSSVYMQIGEFGVLPAKSGEGIYILLTKLYDGAKKIDEGTIARGYVFAANPCLNLLSATVPKWIAANMSDDVIGGGFGSRVIFIYETKVRQREIFYKHLVGNANIPQLKEDLVHDLSIIGRIKGNFILEGWESPDDASKPYGFFRRWYRENSEAPKSTDSRMVGFYNRKPAHVLKVAMLMKLAYSSELILTIPDLEQAITVVEQVEPKILATFQNIGRNIYLADIQTITQFIKDNGPIPQGEILTRFMHVAEPYKILELLQSIVDMGDAEKEWKLIEGYDEKQWIYIYSGD